MLTYSNALFLSSTENVHPISYGVPATVSFLDVSQLDQIEVGEQIVITDTFAYHFLVRIRVDYLVAQRTKGHIRPLRDVEQLARSRLCELASKNRPQLQSSIYNLKYVGKLVLKLIYITPLRGYGTRTICRSH